MSGARATLILALLAPAAIGCGDADIPVPPGAPPATTVASGQHGPLAIAVDEDGVYWTNGGDGTIVMLRKGESEPRVLAKGQGRALGIATDKDSVFWTAFGTEGKSDGAVRKTSKLSKGEVIELMGGQAGPIGIALDDNCVFWTSGGTEKADGIVMSMWKEGVLPVPVASTESRPVDVAVDLSGVFWLDAGLGDSGKGAAVKYVAYIGDPATVLTTDTAGPSRLALDAEHVVWADEGDVQQIDKPPPGAPPDSGEDKVAIATGEDGISGVAIDHTGVYWASADGEVRHATHAGGTPSTLAAGDGAVSDIALDAHGVYWVSESQGAVLMVSK